MAPWVWRLLASLPETTVDVGNLAMETAGLLVGVGAFALAKKRRTAWSGEPMEIPVNTRIDGRLLAGGVLNPSCRPAGRPTMLTFRQWFDAPSSTCTYLLGDAVTGAAGIIDPVFENARRDSALVRELGWRLVASVDTHVHADHVTGARLLHPAHDYPGLTVTSVAEERRYNPRLGGDVIAADFSGGMNNLGLPRPRLIDIAVPANQRCGKPLDGAAQPAVPTWALLTFTFGGIWEIRPATLEQLGRDVQRIDVREPVEFSDALGHSRGASLIPLSSLAERCDPLDRARPVVAVCRSGARSAQATVRLQKAGFSDVVNLAGGMQRWRGERQRRAACRKSQPTRLKATWVLP